MQRRDFLTSSLAASALALTTQAQGQSAAAAPLGKPREFYEIRRYHLQSGPQTKLTDAYVEGALIPALNRLGIGPVGAFHLDIGPETPMLYLLLPCANLEALVTSELRLTHDAEYMKAASPFWSAPATAPAFNRIESSLNIAFEGWPKLVLPASTATKSKRIFQMRTYESPSAQAHARKVEMFQSGEFDVFRASGATQVFYSETLIGDRLPSLTYMLTFADMEHLNTAWDAFRVSPDWKKLTGSPRFAYEAIVSNVTNIILSPATYSQI
jgi:hypothetical protein